MPQFRKVCDVYQGYNYKKDKQTNVGYITAIKVGDTDLAVDQTTCKDPLSPANNVAVVAVLSDVLWELGVTDAIYFSGQLSVYNKQTLLGLIYNTMTNIVVTFQFSVYEYDPIAKKYFKCFHCAKTTMNGLIEKRGEDLNLSVSDDASKEVQSPENYAFNIGIKPKPSQQTLTIATSDTKNVVKPWGLTVSG
ncbi:hypothetical protein WME89_26100 [Sorangium sp. So ce321]|uniref:hypothetical protein n=1 Tax=Sorangium sp. So ce321 TaxID=3133300 RepID=UPI003F619F8B